jgi:hypothetical protein
MFLKETKYLPCLCLVLSGFPCASAALVAMVYCVVCSGCIKGQTNAPEACKSMGANSAQQPKHILGVFPNHNASPCLFPYVPISTEEKFKIASADALDPGGVVVAAFAGGAAQLFNSNRPFGQEASGYTRYFAAAYANHVIVDYLTEGVYPSLLHQDPRYFRKGSGSTGSRVRYAISRVFRTQTDAGGTAFNYSRVLGASSTVAISSLYYANRRNAVASTAGFGVQLGGTMAVNILKEFWPDLSRQFFRKHSATDSRDEPAH